MNLRMKDEGAKDEGTKLSRADDLRVRTREYGLRVVRLFVALPKVTEAQVLGKQLLRSGTSVGANYREAQRARSTAEFVSKIGDCLKGLDESAYWLDLIVGAEIVTARRMAPLIDETNQLTAIFVTIAKKAKASL
jgi:four helix bundle protein